MANSVLVTTPLAGKSCNLKHSVFATKVVNRYAYNYNTWVLDTGATDHIICSATLLTTIASPIPLLNYLMEKVLKLLTLAQSNFLLL